MIKDILSIAVSILGVLIAIIPIFFKSSTIKEVPPKLLVVIIIWLILTFYVSMNLYYIFKGDNPISGNMISNNAVSNDTISDNAVSDDTISDGTFDSAKSIKDNYDLIQKLKASYSEVDTKIIEHDQVEFRIIEKAGIIYRNLNKTGRYKFLEGINVVSAKVFILDLSSDNVLDTFTLLKDTVRYTPRNHDKFYCVVAHSDYDLYVTPPIQVIGGTSYSSVDIYLDKKDVTYTPLTQIRLYMKDSKSDEPYCTIPSDYIIGFRCTGINGKSGNTSYKASKMSDSGLLSFGGCDYFSLNTDYELDISLYHQSDENFELAHQIFDGFIPDSNIAEIIFELDSKSDVSE